MPASQAEPHIHRLIERMDRWRFPSNDPLFQAALKAQDALQGLCVATHYAGCTSGVGKAPANADAAESGEIPEQRCASR